MLQIKTTFFEGYSALFMLVTGAGYALATFGMKLSSQSFTPYAVGITLIGLIIAVISEIALLRRLDLSLVYLSILIVESVLVLILAVMLGDQLTPLQLFGAGLVIIGTLLVSG